MKKAALYLRSSKDRSDISISAQRTQLTKFAANDNIAIVDEFSDAVYSGSTMIRPGYQAMLKAMESPQRNWNTILILDTSRLSRGRYAAQVFKHECHNNNIEIIFSNLPATDPAAKIMLESVFEAMDEVHSVVSKDKGIAGMTENISQGYRAGGSAPKGYQLQYSNTGAIREGKAVTKSFLEKSDEASIVSAFLKLRANGTPRTQALRELEVDWPVSTAIGMEWNALTYAGHLVWNVRYENKDGKYKGGKKRKPRQEWLINKNSHSPLISEQEAETILHNLENSSMAKSVSNAKRGKSNYLLSSVLISTDGRKWEGQQQKAYRLKANKELNLKGRQLQSNLVDQAITDKLICV